MYQLSDSVPYLLARLGIRIGDLFTQVVKRDGLSLQMFRVIAALAEADHPLKLGELAALTSADLSTLSRTVNGMHRGGILLRERPETDQRSLQVTLTAHGRDLAARFMPIASHYEQVATRSLTPAQISTLKSTLMQLYNNLRQIETEIADGTINELVTKKKRITRPAAARSQTDKNTRAHR